MHWIRRIFVDGQPRIDDVGVCGSQASSGIATLGRYASSLDLWREVF